VICFDDPDHIFYWFQQPNFTADDIYKKFHEILFDEKYSRNISKLRVSARAAGGTEKSIQLIEEAYLHHMAAKPIEAPF
jgi:hypothetical protein